jgi:hypothetical protein
VTISIAERDTRTPLAVVAPDTDRGTTMTTAIFVRRGVMTRIAPQASGHEWAGDGTLVRVDCERGVGSVATHYDLSLRVSQQVRGSDEEVHRVAGCWAQGLEKR